MSFMEGVDHISWQEILQCNQPVRRVAWLKEGPLYVKYLNS